MLGTFVTITVAGTNREALNAAVSIAFGEFERIDAIMSLHRDSDLTRLNAALDAKPGSRDTDAPGIPIFSDLFAILVAAQDIARQTGGAFDVTIRPLVDLWGFIRKEGYRLPTDAERRAVLPRVNWRRLELDSATRTIRVHTNGISIDLGGIAKGYAVDCAIEKLRESGITDAMVKAGGDVRVIGAPPGETHWTVQLEDPRKLGRRPTVRLRDQALSTSGDYENFFELNGRRYSHILDPRNGLPVEGVAACTVVAATCMESDAWATALFVLGPDAALGQFGDRSAFRITMAPQNSSATNWRTIRSPRWQTMALESD